MKEGNATSTRTVSGAAGARSLVKLSLARSAPGFVVVPRERGQVPSIRPQRGTAGLARPCSPPMIKTGSVDFSRRRRQRTARVAAIRTLHRTIQSVGATGGVYKGQGRSQRELMTRAY
ncbi:hypothetical protein LWI29_027283 [Acer saccharum]|uniref:Uncharacterized protein n=1 Tax=Acer saccharum TaxID=4024 RepID=A0AA39SPR2_ACESA|nr:hypothetical protein LWI29_009128 [Acer saccharum]KAK0594428.1 hypothetical protein LWI29_027283 [Acer saccharum]